MKKGKVIVASVIVLVLSIAAVIAALANMGEDTGIIIAIAGVLIGLSIVGIALAVTKNGDNVKAEYDERQERARGVAFKYAFFTGLIYNALVGTFLMAEVELPVETSVLFILGIGIGTVVFVSISIWNDAYFSLNEKTNKMMIVFGAIALLNLVGGIRSITEGTGIVDGKLAIGSINMICAVLLIFVLIMIAVKAIYDKKNND